MDTNEKIIYKKPFVGIFVRKSSLRKLLKGKELPRLSPMAKANEQVKLTLYYFSIDDINLEKKLINGTFFNKISNKWERHLFAYPDIIYKRYQPSQKQQYTFDIFKKQLSKINTQPLNYQNGFNKWEVLQHLTKYQNLLPHLPETILYNSPQDLEEMINKHQKVYLKACRGGRGRQVIAVSKLPTGGFKYSFFIKKLYQFKVDSIDTLLTNVLNFYQQKPFIIQAAIDLIQINDRLIDMRPEVQRNGNNEIVLAALPVRIGRDATPITTHADSYNYEDFCREFLDYSEERIASLKTKITDFVTTIYQHVEEAYGPCGELGIDIGLDKNDCLWFIECNSRSRKVSFFNSYDKWTVDKSFINLLEYAQYLYSNRGTI